ncbi:MAG TPA: sensor histidine kinase [Steroidobacteraceae bacterium]|jgi:signal transduction histidine kinase
MFEPTAHVAATSHWVIEWTVIYAAFVVAYWLMPSGDGDITMTPRRAWLLTVQTITGLALVWLYPNFVVAFLMIVVVWQLALLLDFRRALAITVAQVIALAAIQCAGQTGAMTVLVSVVCGGLQLFALCAAQLARGEITARDELARTNAELRTAQALLHESARLGERLRIARDLHDIMGHTLTTLTIHLDVAGRLTSGPAAEHVAHARTAAGELLDQVRSVVSRFRVEPLDLRAALETLAAGTQGLRVELRLPPDLAVADPARAEAVVRCVQEVITNALRHARARELVIEVRNEHSGLAITAQDDGRGGEFTPGNGLEGMRERFENLGGSLAISSTAGAGFMIKGILPLAEGMP